MISNQTVPVSADRCEKGENGTNPERNDPKKVFTPYSFDGVMFSNI